MESAAPRHTHIHAVQQVIAELQAAIRIDHFDGDNLARIVEAKIYFLLPLLLQHQ